MEKEQREINHLGNLFEGLDKTLSELTPDDSKEHSVYIQTLN